MIDGYIDEIMIKEISNLFPDKVIVIRNLPKRLVYEERVKMVSKKDREGYIVDALVPDPKGELVEVLKEGLELSRNGDGSIVFNTRRQVAADALKVIDAYVQGTLPRDVVVPTRVEYSSQRKNMLASPIPRVQVPAIDLPKITRAVVDVASPPAKAEPQKPARTLTPDQRARRVEILRKAREARAAKAAQAKQG